MTHAISATFTRYDRMSPTAAALAVLLHVVTALALWWVSPLNQQNFEQDPIEVTIEQPQPPLQPKPEPPPSAPQAKPSPPPASATSKPAPATPLGLTPPAPTTAETPKQATPKGDTRDAPPALPKAEAPLTQEPKPQEPPPEPQQQAVAPPPPAPARPIELPPVEAPPPPATSQDFFKPPPPAAPPPTPKPETRAAPPPPAQPPRQQLRPSPLREPPQRLPGDPQGSAPSSPFVNPANEAAVTHAHEDYITQVARQLSQYRFHPKDSVAYTRRGVISVFMVVARDGRLLNASIAQSSGAPTFDVEMLGFIRGIAPFPPLPSDLPGNQTSFTLRIPYDLNPG